MKAVLNKEENLDLKSQIYEVGYLLVPTLKEEDIPAVYGNLKDMISSLGAELISDEMPKLIQLAYPMLKVSENKRNNFEEAYFGWIKFDLDTDKIAKIKATLTLDPNVIRFLIIKTVRENTISAKKFAPRDVLKRKNIEQKGEENVESVEINKEEIDKEIEALIAE